MKSKWVMALRLLMTVFSAHARDMLFRVTLFKRARRIVWALDQANKYVVSRFFTHKPIFLTHSVTAKCNCRCKICNVWRANSKTDDMSTHEIFRMLEEARRLNFVAYIALGGEPLMRPDILEILQHSHDLGLYTSIITNGIYLSKFAEKISKVVNLTWVSLDHYTDYHDEMRGFKGSFEKAVEGIKKLKQEGGRVAINCVLSWLNINAIGGMVEFALKLGAKIAFDPMEVFQGSNEEYTLTTIERDHLFPCLNHGSRSFVTQYNRHF